MYISRTEENVNFPIYVTLIAIRSILHIVSLWTANKLDRKLKYVYFVEIAF